MFPSGRFTPMGDTHGMGERRRQSRNRVTAAVGLFFLVSLVGPMALAFAPSDPTEVAVVFPPWHSPARMVDDVAAAQARVVRQGAFAEILVVVSDRPGLVARLYGRGAWVVLDPHAFGGCLVGGPARSVSRATGLARTPS